MMNTYFSILDYIKDSQTDTEAVKKCLLDAEKSVPATVIFSGKDYTLTEAVTLSSHMTVIIEDCTLRLADEICDNLFRGKNVKINPEDPMGMPLACDPIEDIKILGKGNAVIRGPEKNKIGYHSVLQEEQPMVGDFWGWRTYLISLSRCEGFEIAGLSVQKTCGWGLCFDLCRGGHLHDITFDSHVKNGDGIDFRSGCHDCLVEHIRGTTSDDTIACTALWNKNDTFPLKNYLYPHEPGQCIKDRTEDMRNISRITIRDVKTSGVHHAVICLAANGCQVHDITVENITETPSEYWREAVVKIYTGYGAGYTDGDLHDISVNDVRAVYAKYAVYCNAPVKAVTLQKISHPKPERAVKLDYPEDITIL